MLIQEIAEICHEANRALCSIHEDSSQVEWGLADDWQRSSAIQGVKFALANPNAPANAQHEAWMADKLADGWKWGLIKNVITKEHPCLVPFDDLPEHQRAKDDLFRGIVASLAKYLSDE